METIYIGSVCVLHALYLAPGNRHVFVYTVFRDWVAYIFGHLVQGLNTMTKPCLLSHLNHFYSKTPF